MECKNCSHDFLGTYCNHCGQKITDRITLKHLGNQIIEDIFDLDQGLLYTVKQLWINPGTTALDFIAGRRKRYYGPIKYLLLWTAVYFILSPLIVGDRKTPSMIDLVFNSHAPFSSQSSDDLFTFYLEVIVRHTDLYYLGMIPFFTFLSYVLFKKRGFFLAELSIPYLYLAGQIVFVLVMTLPFMALFGDKVVFALLPITFVFIIYFVVVMHKQFFQESWVKTVLKSLTVIYVGQIISGVIAYGIFNVIKFLPWFP